MKLKSFVLLAIAGMYYSSASHAEIRFSPTIKKTDDVIKNDFKIPKGIEFTPPPFRLPPTANQQPNDSAKKTTEKELRTDEPQSSGEPSFAPSTNEIAKKNKCTPPKKMSYEFSLSGNSSDLSVPIKDAESCLSAISIDADWISSSLLQKKDQLTFSIEQNLTQNERISSFTIFLATSEVTVRVKQSPLQKTKNSEQISKPADAKQNSEAGKVREYEF